MCLGVGFGLYCLESPRAGHVEAFRITYTILRGLLVITLV